jgi:hypothetical protein
MKGQCLWAIGAVVTTLGLCIGDVQAQPPVPGGAYSRPPIYSPYLNLARGGSPAINYYGLVRPEMQFRQSIQNLAGDIAANQQAIGNLNTSVSGSDLPFTGHPTQFMNLGGYFMNNGSSLGVGTSRNWNSTMNFARPSAPSVVGGGTTPLRRP